MIKYFLGFLFTLSGTCHAQSYRGLEIIEKSIQFHDPDNVWMKSHFTLDIKETRPGGPNRNTLVEIDNTSSYFNLVRQQEQTFVQYEFINDICNLYLNGESNFSESNREKYNLSVERGRLLRDYYIYLWGLPMKLLDPGTIVHEEVEEINFHGMESYRVRVTYDNEIGSDIWYFYMDRTDFQLLAYQFFHDESINDGEYILLKDLMKVGTMNLPKERSWFINKDHKDLGTDILENNMLKLDN